MNDDILLEITDLKKNYGAKSVLNGISFGVKNRTRLFRSS